MMIFGYISLDHVIFVGFRCMDMSWSKLKAQSKVRESEDEKTVSERIGQGEEDYWKSMTCHSMASYCSCSQGRLDNLADKQIAHLC